MKLLLFLFFYFALLTNADNTNTNTNININNCNKMWGVTQDANGRMLYKVSMYMCVEDPYNIYKNTYLKSSNNNVLPSSLLAIKPLETNNTTNYTINQSQIDEYVGDISSKTTTISPILEKTTFYDTKHTDIDLNNGKNENKSTHLENIIMTTKTSTTSKYPTSTTTISPNFENKNKKDNEKVDEKQDEIEKNTTNVENKTISVNLRTMRNQNLKDNDVENTSSTNEPIVIILTIVGITLGSTLIVGGIVYYRKVTLPNRKRKSTRPTSTPTPHPKRKPTVKPFMKDVTHCTVDPHAHNNSDKNKNTNPNTHQHTNTPPTTHHTNHNPFPYVPRSHRLRENVTTTTLPSNKKINHLSVNTKDKPRKVLNIKHDALTPNTQKILDESKRDVKRWYKKTFPGELIQSKSNIPLPPLHQMSDKSNNETTHHSQHNHRIHSDSSFFAR